MIWDKYELRFEFISNDEVLEVNHYKYKGNYVTLTSKLMNIGYTNLANYYVKELNDVFVKVTISRDKDDC